MQDINKTQEVIDALRDAGINAVKVDSPLFQISIGNETPTVTVVSKIGSSLEEGIQHIISENPLVVFVKDVYIDNTGTRIVFRYQTIKM